MRLYDFVDMCREEGLTAEEVDNAYDEYQRDLEESHNDFLDRYYDDPLVRYGWAQQDLIDLRRFEQ